MFAALAIAAACAAWHGSVAGYYDGVVESVGPKRIETWLTVGPDDRLSGRYVLHEPDRDVEGTLEQLTDSNCDTVVFRWTDVYGTGAAQLRFFPDQHCFQGAWGTGATVNPALDWNTCTRERVTS